MDDESGEVDGGSVNVGADDMCELACVLCFEIQMLKELLKDGESGKTNKVISPASFISNGRALEKFRRISAVFDFTRGEFLIAGFFLIRKSI